MFWVIWKLKKHVFGSEKKNHFLRFCMMMAYSVQTLTDIPLVCIEHIYIVMYDLSFGDLELDLR